jgi:ADP-dependent phosphofructokinase/glucokinase
MRLIVASRHGRGDHAGNGTIRREKGLRLAIADEVNGRMNALNMNEVEVHFLLGIIGNLAPDVLDKALDVLESSITKRDTITREETSNG